MARTKFADQSATRSMPDMHATSSSSARSSGALPPAMARRATSDTSGRSSTSTNLAWSMPAKRHMAENHSASVTPSSLSAAREPPLGADAPAMARTTRHASTSSPSAPTVEHSSTAAGIRLSYVWMLSSSSSKATNGFTLATLAKRTALRFRASPDMVLIAERATRAISADRCAARASRSAGCCCLPHAADHAS